MGNLTMGMLVIFPLLAGLLMGAFIVWLLVVGILGLIGLIFSKDFIVALIIMGVIVIFTLLGFVSIGFFIAFFGWLMGFTTILLSLSWGSITSTVFIVSTTSVSLN